MIAYVEVVEVDVVVVLSDRINFTLLNKKTKKILAHVLVVVVVVDLLNKDKYFCYMFTSK